MKHFLRPEIARAQGNNYSGDRMIGPRLSRITLTNTAAEQMDDQNPGTNEERGKQIGQKGEERCCLVREEGNPSLTKGVQREAPGSVRIISVIHDCEPGKANAVVEGHGSHQPQDCEIPPSPLFTKYSRKSTSSSSESLTSHQVDNGIDCAGVILNCLFCRFSDLFRMLPASCERATYNCCPAFQHFIITVDNTPSDEWNCDLDFGLFDACQDTGECLELAMEISEICYH